MTELTLPEGATNKLRQIATKEEWHRIKTDPVYFIDTYGSTFDPRPEANPHHLPFKLYPFQCEYVLWLVKHIREGKDCLTEKSRDMGASWLVLSVLVWFWLFEPGFQCLIGSRKEDLVDNKTLDSLFGKIEYIIDRLPFCPEGLDLDKHRTYMRLTNPMNGNVIKGESANQEFSRQGRYRVIFLDEGAFWDNIDTAWTAAGDASPCRMLVTTPPKKTNFIKYLRFSGKINVYTLHWKSHPLKNEIWYQQQCERRTSEEIAQELDINWEGSVTGRMYPEIDFARVGTFPYVPGWPLFVSHDFGHHPDPHSIGWFQVDPSTGRIRLVETFEKTNQEIRWFLPLFGKAIQSEFSYTSDDLAMIEFSKDLPGASHFGDPAGRQKNEESGRSVIQTLAEYEIYVNSNTKANDYESRKTEAKKVLKILDINDTPNNKYFVECIKNARYPDRDGSQTITPNDKPIHDWTSHNRSMLEYFAVNFEYAKPSSYPEGETFAKALAGVYARKTNEFIIR